MTKRKSQGEHGTFADAMAGVEDLEPIDRDKIAKSPLPPDTNRASGDSRVESTKPAAPNKSSLPAPVVANRAEMKRLRAGKIRPQKTIDLHGYTRDNAYRRLCNEVARANTAGLRCVLVIHGKGHHSSEGSTTIKESLAEWIVQPPLVHHVTGCTLARPQDGGSGASYVLLR